MDGGWLMIEENVQEETNVDREVHVTAGREVDYMTAPAPSDRVDWLRANDQKLGRKGAEHDDYRL